MGNLKRSDIHFNPKNHEYTIKGVVFPGITGFIGKRTKKDFSSAGRFVEEYRDFGSRLHKEIEHYIRDGVKISHPSARFVQEILDIKYPSSIYARLPEVLVSDYERVCTAIDIVVYEIKECVKRATIFDIKTGNFDREYCTWQLSIGKFLLEKDGDFIVDKAFVISVKDKRFYEIIIRDKERCEDFIKGKAKKVL